MNLEDIRPSFSIYLISPQPEQLEGLSEALTLAGYLTSSFADLDAAFTEVAINPPHVIVAEDPDGVEGLARLRDRVRTHLPETHVIALAPIDARAEYAPLLAEGIYDVVYLPLAAPIEVQRAIDRAIERDYFMYQNERLIAEPPPAAPALLSVRGEEPTHFARQLFALKTVDACVDAFLREVGTPGVFFRYLPNRRTLIAANAHGIEPEKTNGVGLNLNDAVPNFRNAMLREPRQLPPFREMVNELLHAENFALRFLEHGGEVAGIFVFPNHAEEDAGLDDRLMLLDRAVGLLEAQKRLHVVNTRDDATEVLARPHFVECVVNEISRARRVNLPVSVLAMAFDQYDIVGAEVGPDEAQLMLKTVARLCEKYSRVNDVIGRIGASELGLLLPHTAKRGALIKAERLRRALAQADFSKVLRTHPRVTVSIGVSEYPSLARDAEELLNNADETLFHIRKQGNRTAIAEAPAGFTPDFVVREPN